MPTPYAATTQNAPRSTHDAAANEDATKYTYYVGSIQEEDTSAPFTATTQDGHKSTN